MKIRKGSLNEYALIALEKAVDGFVRYDDLIHHSSQYAWGERWDKPLKKSLLAQALRRLREKGLIEYEKERTSKIILKLTDLGRDALGELLISDEEWDGKWRIVLFDIPKSKNLVRDMFRRRLKDWKFKKWQQSVWITKSNVTDRLRKIIERLGINEWVVVVESDDPTIKNIIN